MRSGTLLRLRGSGSEQGPRRMRAPTVTLLTLATKRRLYPHSGRAADVPGQARDVPGPASGVTCCCKSDGLLTSGLTSIRPPPARKRGPGGRPGRSAAAHR